MVKGVCLDLAGVLYEGEKPVPGAVAAVSRLRAAGIAVRFLTNSTRRPRRAVLSQLVALGFEVAPDELFTPASAAMARLMRDGSVPHLLIHPDLAEDFEGAPSEGDPVVVVGDAGPYFTYDRMNAAFHVLDTGAGFLALAANRVFRNAEGVRSMDAGPFVAALEYAVGRKAEVLGKPAPAFFAAALASMQVAPGDAVMIGDDAEADVAGALRAGFGAAVLVRSGKYLTGDEARFSPRPSAVTADIAGAVDWVLSRSPALSGASGSGGVAAR